MPVGSVVLTPAAPGTDPVDWSFLAAALRDADVAVVVPDLPPEDDGHPSTGPARTAHWVAHCALGIRAAEPREPVLLVAAGPAGAMLPALGFAQRAARRAVAGYVLLDAALPRPGAAADWPDAPVVCVLAGAASGTDTDAAAAADDARRRGWEVVVSDDPAGVLVELARRP